MEERSRSCSWSGRYVTYMRYVCHIYLPPSPPPHLWIRVSETITLRRRIGKVMMPTYSIPSSVSPIHLQLQDHYSPLPNPLQNCRTAIPPFVGVYALDCACACGGEDSTLKLELEWVWTIRRPISTHNTDTHTDTQFDITRMRSIRFRRYHITTLGHLFPYYHYTSPGYCMLCHFIQFYSMLFYASQFEHILPINISIDSPHRLHSTPSPPRGLPAPGAVCCMNP